MANSRRAEVAPEDAARVHELSREYDRLQGLFPQLSAVAVPEDGDFDSAHSIRSYIRTLEQVADKMEEIEEAMTEVADELDSLGYEGED